MGLLVGPILIGAVYATYGALSIFPVVAVVALLGSAFAMGLPRWTTSRSPSTPPRLPGHA